MFSKHNWSLVTQWPNQHAGWSRNQSCFPVEFVLEPMEKQACLAHLHWWEQKRSPQGSRLSRAEVWLTIFSLFSKYTTIMPASITLPRTTLTWSEGRAPPKRPQPHRIYIRPQITVKFTTSLHYRLVLLAGEEHLGTYVLCKLSNGCHRV